MWREDLMPYSPKDLEDEIRRIIAARSAAGAFVSRNWLVTEVLHAHPEENIDEFTLCCCRMAVSSAVDKALFELLLRDEVPIDPGEEDEGELALRLPEWRHLRPVYPVRRDGVSLVPLDQMTDDEIEAKAETYEGSSRPRAAHAAELRRYRAEPRRRQRARRPPHHAARR